jgi:Permuted papain-like amidase enzyme, YaeF/YiiX, C92 family
MRLPAPGILVLYTAIALSCRSSPDDSPASRHVLVYDLAIFRSGDVVLRRGQSALSYAVLSADSRSRYSHVGLVSVKKGKVWVIHTVPQQDGSREPGGVRIEQVSDFLAPARAVAAAVYRPKDLNAAPLAVRTAHEFARRHLPFDGAFDLATPDRLYCTELIWRAYLAAGVDLAEESKPADSYLFPSGLERSRHLTLITTFEEIENQ